MQEMLEMHVSFNPWVGKIPCRREWQPTPVFLPENPMDRRAWQAIVCGVAKSQTQLKQLSTQNILGNLEII